MPMKTINWSGFACLAILVMNAVSPSKGLKFSGGKYVFLLSLGTPKGPMGKVQVLRGSSVAYACLNKTSLISINKDTGSLTLLKELDHKASAQFNNTQLTIQAAKSDNSQKAITTIIIIILPPSCGDHFVEEMIDKSKTLVKTNHILKTSNGNTVKITAASLHRFLREISESAKATSMAQVKMEKFVELIKAKIIKQFEKLFGKNAVVYGFLRVKSVLSEKKMKEMESEAMCRKPTAVDPNSCPVRPVFRTFDGTCNNRKYPNLGASSTAFIRLLPAQYFDVDGLNDPIGFPNQPNAPSVPSPFEISRDFIIDEVASKSSPTLTHVVMQYGQFVDHDLDLAVDSEGSDMCREVSCDGSPSDFEAPCFPILPLPDGSTNCIRAIRSAAVCQQENGYPKTREQINVNTAFIDASHIYGSTKTLADFLRQNMTDDQGLLRSSNGLDGELLPLDTRDTTEEELCENFGGCFIAGDARSNEQQALAAFHSLFLREHNRIARTLKVINGHWSGERVYQEARKIMGALFQKITYYDFLPLILGPKPLPTYKGYKGKVDPGVSNSFATAAFRFGHSTIRAQFELLNKNFDSVAPAINLRFMFFNNTVIQRIGIEPILYGLVGNLSEIVDRTLSPGIVRHLFERENSPGQNLAALNIHRSRDHGLPGYNEYRKFCKLGGAKTFEDTKNEIKDPVNRNILKRLYNDDPNLAELWVAGLAETPLPGASVGPTFKCIIADQFRRSRDGDRFFYKRRGIFRKDKLKEINKSSLSRIYCDNLKTIVSIQKNAFLAPTESKPRISCERIPGIDLCVWKENKYFKRSCLHGFPKTAKGKTKRCRCVCKRPWSGARCERRRATTSVPWHATILSAGKVKCSGAWVNNEYVLTTRRCATGLVNGRVRLGDFRSHLRDRGERTFVIKSIHYPTKRFSRINDIALIRLSVPVIPNRRSKIIAIGKFSPLNRIKNHLSAWGGGRILQRLEVTTGSRTSCKQFLKSFNPRRNICTLKASFPFVTNRLTGSPLIQYRKCRPHLIGLLTSVERVPSSRTPRFANYIRPSKFSSWLNSYL